MTSLHTWALFAVKEVQQQDIGEEIITIHPHVDDNTSSIIAICIKFLTLMQTRCGMGPYEELDVVLWSLIILFFILMERTKICTVNILEVCFVAFLIKYFSTRKENQRNE